MSNIDKFNYLHVKKLPKIQRIINFLDSKDESTNGTPAINSSNVPSKEALTGD